MTTNEYVSHVGSDPRVRELFANDNTLMRDHLTTLVRFAIDRITTAFDFPFVVKETTTTSVVDTAEYTLTGTNNNARDIVSIRYADDNRLLEQLTQHDYEVKYDDATLPSKVLEWVKTGETQTGVTVRLIGTPSSAETIRYRFKISDLYPEQLGREWESVIVSIMKGELFAELRPVAERDLTEMIDRYRTNDVGNAADDPTWRKRNIERANLYGY